jgi:arylsulfatase A-like enzyme
MDPHAPYAAPGDARLKYSGDYAERRDFLHFMPSQAQQPASDFPPLTADEQRHLADLYDAEVAYFDEQLGHLVDELRQRGLLANTLIVVTADHGEELFEHGHIGHGYSLYDELLHVPLVFCGPSIPSSTRCEVPVGTAGLAATLLDVAGARLAGIAEPLLPPPAKSAAPVFSTVRTELFGPHRVLVSGQDGEGRKVVLAWDDTGAPLDVLVFRLASDPGEQAPDPDTLTPDEVTAFTALRKAATSWSESTAAACPPGPQPYSPEIDKGLRQNGYLGGDQKPR